MFFVLGKLDIRKITGQLEKKSGAQTTSGDLDQSLTKIWSDLLGCMPKMTDNFVLDAGGDSLRAVKFIDSLETEYPLIDHSKCLDLLLNSTFSALRDLVQDELMSLGTSVDQASHPQPKRFKPSPEINDQLQLDSSISAWLSKSTSVVKHKGPSVSGSTGLKVVWTHDTKKCIDATPLVVVEREGRIRVYIGSHSKAFVCVDGASGQLHWKFEAKDRIESSATLSKCGQYVIVGWSRAFILEQQKDRS